MGISRCFVFCFFWFLLSFFNKFLSIFCLFQGWKWSSTGLLPVCVLGAVSWIAGDIQVSKPVVRAAVLFFSISKASGEVCEE